MNTTAKLINEIDWSLDKDFHYGIENARYIDALINQKLYLPIKNSLIKFSDDNWDFRPYSIRKTLNLVFNFTGIPPIYLTTVKYFALLSLLNQDRKITTINNDLKTIKNFVNYLYNNNINSIELVKESTIINYINLKDKRNPMGHIKIAQNIENFFKFIFSNYSYKMYFELSIFKQYHEKATYLRRINENYKYPDIPKEYFSKLFCLLVKSMRDDELNYKDRSLACIYVILSQTGLRISEITTLEINSLCSLSLKNLNTDTYYLKYKDFKSSGKQLEYILGETYANSYTVEAFTTLLNLRPKTCAHNYIYIPNSNAIPATDEYVRGCFSSFMLKYAPFSHGSISPYPELKVKRYRNHHLFLPTTPQFRVHVCTELYHTHGVSEQYIRKYMNHLSTSMTGYYVRPKQNKEENLKFSEQLLTELVTNQATLLGNDSKQIFSNINDFILKKNLNVQTDLEAIIKSLKNEFVIRAKRGGVCIKTSLRDCSKDARTNELFCAYDLCPNLFHLYYMANITYEDFKLTQKTYEYNINNGFNVQATKELIKIKNLCQRKLLPELQCLNEKITANGVNAILDKHPELTEIVLNYSNIINEITIWLGKK